MVVPALTHAATLMPARPVTAIVPMDASAQKVSPRMHVQPQITIFNIYISQHLNGKQLAPNVEYYKRYINTIHL